MELLALNGHYAKLWAHQSGGFLSEDVPEEAHHAAFAEHGPLDDMRPEERPEPDVDNEPPPART